jgi:hypothetical protein
MVSQYHGGHVGKKYRDERRERIVGEIRKTVEEVRRHETSAQVNMTVIADLLNKKGVLPMLAKKWTAHNLGRFCDQYLPGIFYNLPEGSPADDIARAKEESPKSSDFDRGVTRQFTDSEVEEIRELLLQYKKLRVDVSSLSRRPVFKGPRTNSGIRCDDVLRRRALAKARQDSTRTGGNLSSLIELLLWEYLGRPEDVVESY